MPTRRLSSTFGDAIRASGFGARVRASARPEDPKRPKARKSPDEVVRVLERGAT